MSRTYSKYVDWLAITGGWHTIDRIALEMGTNPETTRQAVHRLARRGRIEKRNGGRARYPLAPLTVRAVEGRVLT